MPLNKTSVGFLGYFSSMDILLRVFQIAYAKPLKSSRL
uniref:Uncharacterized protein n=1 Tax=Arundo donax TaxID=35708 RepID=A0A0A8YVS9_ARUDO